MSFDYPDITNYYLLFATRWFLFGWILHVFMYFADRNALTPKLLCILYGLWPLIYLLVIADASRRLFTRLLRRFS